MTTKTLPAGRRAAMKTAYMMAYDNFAVHASEVAKALGMKPASATRLLKSMPDLITWDQVNGTGPLVYQAYETYDYVSREEAEAKFDAAYPAPEAEAKTSPSHKGATGPRYSDKQLAKGREARLAGQSWIEVAKAAGVKSDGYFSRVLREHFPELAAKPAPAKAKAKPAKKSATKKPRRTVRRSAKATA